MTIPNGRIDLDALAPCPFCGSHDVSVGGSMSHTAVWCRACKTAGPSIYHGGPTTERATLNRCEAEAITAWNRRAAIPSEQGEAVWRTDWQNAPRDGTPVRLRYKYKGRNDETTLAWSTNYSVYGLGGCWSDGFCTMGDLDFAGWLPAHPAPAAGVKVKALEWRELTSPREDGPAEPNGEWEALCVFGAYSIDFDTDDDVAKYPFCVWTPEDSLGHFASADDAKAAAQADYEARILSAIDQGEPK